ncbi:type II toxin-antitoxin system VapC family toxin [Spirosoma sp. KUDC1026]|uniref:type II toxin-antitoxin system VapC family toxin n=1 Tax=Spirosoma sp. KUDC1026 TaxID=2745947 RepID=UPI00159B99E7|nr:type II toxin-antitoxin system VapC family toxin [Spirosoma sp. KUDC1026]QKZ15538.1 PIN domain-containing protein [Spirosoma sp. KUDC1026]
MSSKIFLDSSILVEKTKGTKPDLFDFLFAYRSQDLCINQTVLSEYTFYLLIIEGGKAPVTLKRDAAISSIIRDHNPVNWLKSITYLELDNSIITEYLRLMQRYNLLPNDALILATCKLHGVTYLASYDNDFGPACAGEEIKLIQQIDDLD